MPVRVVFCDDSFLVREGVSGLLTETEEVDLVATATNPDRRRQADPGRVP
jgi:hypothetical protein